MPWPDGGELWDFCSAETVAVLDVAGEIDSDGFHGRQSASPDQSMGRPTNLPMMPATIARLTHKRIWPIVRDFIRHLRSRHHQMSKCT
ncbi:MAG TPA: hypothetical protein DEG88_10785 [Propionibacteriaceae bacterium]|nr:hypothetical protein [Propionibacteriaceae bacterium]